MARDYSLQEYKIAVKELHSFGKSKTLNDNEIPSASVARHTIDQAYSIYSPDYVKYNNFLNIYSETEYPKTLSSLKESVNMMKEIYDDALEQWKSIDENNNEENLPSTLEEMMKIVSPDNKAVGAGFQSILQGLSTALNAIQAVSNVPVKSTPKVVSVAEREQRVSAGAVFDGKALSEPSYILNTDIAAIENGLSDPNATGTRTFGLQTGVYDWGTSKMLNGQAVATNGLSADATPYSVVGTIANKTITPKNVGPQNIIFRSVPKNTSTGGIENYSKWIYDANGYPSLVPYSYNGSFDAWKSVVQSNRWVDGLGLVESGEDHIVKKRLGIEADTYQDYYQNFNRYYNIYPELEMSDFKSWVFITRPDLWIFENDYKDLAGGSASKTSALRTGIFYDPYMRYMFQMFPVILKSLTPGLDTNHDFIPFLMDRTESLQLQDYNVKTEEVSQLHTGYKLQYASNALESKTGGTVDLTFREDSWGRVTKLFNTWIHYIDGVVRDIFRPRREMVYLNKIDYTCSIYHFLCDQTGEDIVYFSKYTGCFPINANHANFSHQLHGGIDNKVDVTFAYSDFDTLNLEILTDFNLNSRQRGPVAPHYETYGIGDYIVGAPFVYYPRSGRYKLIWNKAKTDLNTLGIN